MLFYLHICVEIACLIFSYFKRFFLYIENRIRERRRWRLLRSSEGRRELAQAMAQPIRRALDYQALGNRLLMLEELPQGAYARYQNEVANSLRNSNNYSSITTAEINPYVCGHFWAEDIHVTSLFNNADTINNNVSQILSDDFNTELDRDTYSADR